MRSARGEGGLVQRQRREQERIQKLEAAYDNDLAAQTGPPSVVGSHHPDYERKAYEKIDKAS